MSRTVLESIFSHAKTAPDAPCLLDRAGICTYRGHAESICGIADALAGKVARGDAVVIKCDQTETFLAAVHAVQLLGGVAVPVEKTCADARLCEIFAAVGERLIIGDRIKEPPAVAELIPLKSLAALRSAGAYPLPEADSTSLILFTTGTTGRSKGIEMTHKADFAVAQNVLCGTAMKSGNVEILPMPLNHSYALRRYFSSMINGSAVCLPSGTLMINAIFSYLDRGATSIALAPSLLSQIFALTGDKLGNYAASLDFVQLGSAPLGEKDKRKLRELLPGSRLYNLYGSTEAGCACILDFSTDDDRPHCIGRPTVNSVVRLTDGEGREVAAATAENPALLSWGGAMLMRGYFGEPALTAETVADGFVKTSDLGYIDEAGRVYMLGRADDVIMCGGQKIAPTEVEAAAADFAGLADCCCAPRADAQAGQIAVLYYETTPGAEVDHTALRAHIAAKVEGFKIPRDFVQLDKLPRTYNGKLDRKALKNRE